MCIRDSPDAVGRDHGAALVRGPQRVEYGGGGWRTESGPGQGDQQIGAREPVQSVRDGERYAAVRGHRAGPVAAQGEVETGQRRSVGTEHLGDDADGEHADAGRGVRGNGLEGRHGRSVAHGWHESCDQGQQCHS